MASTQLSEAEIARRLPVWTALADIFLDTELDTVDYRHIAEVIARSGFTPGAIEVIFRNEVAPAFITNLWSVAGEWQGWSEDFVRERVMANRGSKLAKTINRLFHRSMLEQEWSRISAFF